MKVFVYGHTLKSESEAHYVRQLLATAQQLGIEVFIFAPYSQLLRQFALPVSELSTIDSKASLLSMSPDAVITLGGDGTILRAITLIGKAQIPVLGINLGRLGFLASVEKQIIDQALRKLVSRDFTISSRSVLSLTCNLPIFEDFPYALNDFTLNKRDTSSMITAHTYVDDVLLNSYWADGLIISTPTGSTGYSLSCGGPIMFPDAGNFAVTPVAPHNLNVRPIVIADSHTISVVVEGRGDSFMCTLDSRYETITPEHKIYIRKADFMIHFIQLGGQSFMKTLQGKLHWGIDKRN
jgi:NAD+ kinase